MKSYALIVLLIAGSPGLTAQEVQMPGHHAGQCILSASPTFLLNTPNGVQVAGGIKFQLFLGKRFSIDADMVFGRDYLHMSPAVIGVPIGLAGLSSGNEDAPIKTFLFSAAALVLSLEHLSYHITVTPDLDISPYVSLLRFKYAYNRKKAMEPDFESEQLSFAGGVQINKYYGRFVFSPYAEYNIGYSDHISGFNVGIYLGIYFPGKGQR
jgi:hypothetical protein